MGYFSLTRLGVQTCRVTSFDDQFLYSKQWFGVVESYLYTNFVSKNEILSFQVLKSNFLIGYFLFKSSEKFVKSLHLPFHIMKVNMTWIWVSTSPPPMFIFIMSCILLPPHFIWREGIAVPPYSRAECSVHLKFITEVCCNKDF